jgi:hypothetical protein
MTISELQCFIATATFSHLFNYKVYEYVGKYWDRWKSWPQYFGGLACACRCECLYVRVCIYMDGWKWFSLARIRLDNLYSWYPKVSDDGTLIQILYFWTLSIVLFYIKYRPVYISKYNDSDTGSCLRLQVKPTQLGPIDKASPYLRWRRQNPVSETLCF